MAINVIPHHSFLHVGCMCMNVVTDVTKNGRYSREKLSVIIKFAT